LIIGVLVTLLALLFTDLPLYHWVITLVFVLMTATLFSLAGLINAVYANSFDDISIVPTFILTPLTYFGGVFYSVNLLPEPWQSISYFNPILHMVNAFRYGMLGVSDVSVVWAFVGVGLGVVVLFSVCLHLLKHGK